MKLRGKQAHISYFISVFLLMVFAIALTPFSAFHHHREEAPQCTQGGKACTHSFHIHKHADNCLICAAHFEKNYTHTEAHYQVYLNVTPVLKSDVIIGCFYTEEISLALRGPPSILS